MSISVLSILAGWIIFSTLLVTIILVNSSRLSHSDYPENGSGLPAGDSGKKGDHLAALIKMLNK